MKYEIIQARAAAQAACDMGDGARLVEVPLWLADMVTRPMARGHVRADLLSMACENLLEKDHAAKLKRMESAFARAQEVDGLPKVPPTA